MATIKSGLNIFVYNGPEADLNAVPWLPNVRALYQINSDRTGWESFKYLRPYPAFEVLTVNTFYLIDAYRDFALPDAQTYACATGGTSSIIPAGLSLFVYSGVDLPLSGASFLPSVSAIYQINDINSGWDSFKPNRPYPAFETLVQGTFYFTQANSSFTLAGAQVIGCVDTFGSETIDGALYVKYPDLLGAIPLTANPKTAPNMPLFKAKIEALEAPHNHDIRYYQKTETYTQAEVNALLQGVTEVREYDNKSLFPATGLAATLYIDKQFNVAYRWNGTAYVAVGSSGVDLTPYLKITDAANIYQVKGDYLTNAQADGKYQFKGDYLTKPEAATSYQPKGNYVQSASANGGAAQTPDAFGHINLNFSGGGFREVEDFVYNGGSTFILKYLPIRVYHVFPNGLRTKLFSVAEAQVTVTAAMTNGQDVAIDYHHNGVLTFGIFDESFDDSFE